MRTPSESHPVSRFKYPAIAVLVSVLVAAFANLVIEFLQTGGNAGRLFSYTLGAKPWLFVLGTSIIWCILLLIWALVGRLWVATALLAALTAGIGYANYKKMTLRLEPLLPSDLGFAGNAGFLEQMVGPGTVIAILSAVVLVAVVFWLLARIVGRKWPRLRRPLGNRLLYRITARVCAIAVSLTVLAYSAHFNDPGNRLRAVYNSADADWAFWYQRLNYFNNGFVGGLLYNLNVPAMEAPPGYGKEAMEAIADRYAQQADNLNAGRPRLAGRDVNFVLVLSEAFSDPTKLKGVSYAEDPIPHTRKLMQRTPSGTMLAQLFGGGTANMEFELLTGMSLAQFEPQMQTPYQMLIPNYRRFPSAVGLSKQLGMRPIAVHPYMTSMYKREKVYPILGFDDFIGESDIPEAEPLEQSPFISDQSAYDEVLRQIDDSASPLFLNLVTMQNHFPMSDHYAHGVPVAGVRGDFKDEAEGYGRGLEYSDVALKKFLAMLKDIDEPTAVVFYGDHQPAFWPKDVRDRNGQVAMQSTPFFLWANFPLDSPKISPVTSPIYFLPLLFDAMGVELPPYYALLLDMYRQIPAMEQDIYLDPEGDQLDPQQLPAKARQVLRDYRLVQYDLSVGKRYSQGRLLYPADTSMPALP